MDNLLRIIDDALGFSRLSTLVYLTLVLIAVFMLTVLLQLFKIKGYYNDDRDRGFLRKLVFSVIIVNVILVLVGTIVSLNTFHFSSILLFSTLMIPASAYLMVFVNGDTSRARMVLVAMSLLVVFLFGSRHLIVGVEEGETTSDMINIYVNGRFRWSIHGSHYDLAPLDAVLKVMLSYVVGGSIYDAMLASAMYSSYGLSLVLLVYSLVRRLNGSPALIIAVILLSILSHPYSPVIGLSVPPVPHAHLLAVIALAVLLKPLLGHGFFGIREYVLVSPLVVSSTLMHPSTLSFLVYLALLALLLYYRGDLARHKHVVYVILLALALHLLKILYTAWITGFISYINLLWEYIVNAFSTRELTTFTTRNIAYSGLPRLSITGFAVLPGFVGGLALMMVLRRLRGEALNFIEQFFIVTAVFYAVFATASLLTGIGGVSQSRALFNNAQPYMELVLITYLSYFMAYFMASHDRVKRLLVLLPLLLASLSTLVTPNALPLNYTIPMAKPATVNDHIIAYMFTELVDRGYYTSLYSNCGDLGRMAAVQSRGDFHYGLGSTMAGVYYFIAPRVIPARSYWDPCVMAIGKIPESTEGYTVSKAFDAWVYEFYLYTRN